MTLSASLYAPEPGVAVPAASGAGVYVSSLLNLLRDTEPPLEVHTRWLRAADVRGRSGIGAQIAAARWIGGELGRMLSDRSRYLIFTYPHAPFLARIDVTRTRDSAMLSWIRWAYRALRSASGLGRRRLILTVQDMPIEMAEGRAIAGGYASELPARQLRAIEHALFEAADRLIVPEGFVDTIRERHGIGGERLRTHRRQLYRHPSQPEPAAGIEFAGGKVNFFYSGSVDPHVAANFREILRAIRNAPQTRLHVCGPGVQSVREWLSELDVPNAHHYGQLAAAQHDWLAQKCQIGLILYPSDNPYNHLTPTMKYSAYLANGLAVLSTDLAAVGENIRRDGVGQAMPIRELAVELLRWATRPALWTSYKSNAEARASYVRSAGEMKDWLAEIASGR